MDIVVTQSAEQTGILRVWLDRVPESSESVYAFRVNDDGEEGEIVGEAIVYGRGEDSSARQKTMLYFRLSTGDDHQPIAAGETLRLKTYNVAEDNYENAKLYILSVE